MQKKPNVQFITDDNGIPIYAVIPISHYEALTMHYTAIEEAPSPLIQDDRYILLPEAPGERIDLYRLVDYCLRQALVAFAADDDREQTLKDYLKTLPVEISEEALSEFKKGIPINARTQALRVFEKEFSAGLDPLIRRHFLPKDSPYRNTMQATTAVVDALVKTGLFSRSKRKFNFYRPVNALDFNLEAAREFMKGKEVPKPQIEVYFWLYPEPK